MDRRDLFTEPLLNSSEHFILDLGVTVVVVGVVECLEDLAKGEHNGIKGSLISSTLLMTSSGFELFDQAFNRIQNPAQSSGMLV